MDFDFGKALKSQTAAQQAAAMGLARTDNRHMTASASVPQEGGLQYRSAVQRSLDGNTVDMDVERSAFTDNALKYQSTLTFLNRRISGLMDAIKGGQ